MTFQNYSLSSTTFQALEDLGYVAPTDIQRQALPKLLNDDRDFIGQAQTGTGKTLAFVLPLLEKLSAKDRKVQALILTPTRELAQQVCQEVEKLGKYSALNAFAVYGGAPYEKQIKAIKQDRPQIIVGTPGRVIDLMDRLILDLSAVKYLVLDEADEMLNMGFFDDVQTVLNASRDRRALWMFSATMPKPILSLIAEHFDSPEIVHVEKQTLSNSDIEQFYYAVPAKSWEEALCRLFEINIDMYGIVFCNTKKETWELTESLLTKGYLVEGLHGDMGQVQRERAMARFKSGRTRLLICTDVAARGIDVNNLTHVINYGLPRDIESYVHRIGRTGRAGMKGTAIALIDPKQFGVLRRIENFTRQKMTKGEFPTSDQLKSALLKKELESTANLIDAIKNKGDEFQIDSLYNQFADYYKDLNREELLKLMFSSRFNKVFRKLNEMVVMDSSNTRPERRSSNHFEKRRMERSRSSEQRPGRRPERREKEGNFKRDRDSAPRKGKAEGRKPAPRRFKK